MDEARLKELKERDFFSKEDNFKKFEHIKSELILGNKNRKVPFVSILIPTFKREKLLKQTIQSVLNQENYNDYEIVIVDNEAVFDKETETERVVRSFNSDKIFYYRNKENLGMYGNWGRCISLARTKWVCMVHDDDALVKNHLSVMTSIIKKNPKIDFLACRYQGVDERERGAGDINRYSEPVPFNEKYLKAKSYKDYNFGFATLYLGGIFNREKALDIGGFKVSKSYCEDYFFVAKFAYYYNIYTIDTKLYLYRWAVNQSLKTDMWEEEIVYEYYLSKFISEKRNIVTRRFYKLLSKYYTIKRINDCVNGKSSIKAICNIDSSKVYNLCNIKGENINKIALDVSKFIMLCDKVVRRIHDLINKNIKVNTNTVVRAQD